MHTAISKEQWLCGSFSFRFSLGHLKTLYSSSRTYKRCKSESKPTNLLFYSGTKSFYLRYSRSNNTYTLQEDCMPTSSKNNPTEAKTQVQGDDPICSFEWEIKTESKENFLENFVILKGNEFYGLETIKFTGN